MADRAHVRAAVNLLTGIVFAGLLAMPALDTTFGLDRTALEEKRQLALWPGLPLSLQAVAELSTDFDAYVDDHFGFRSLLLRLHARATVCWLGVPPSPKVEIIVGRHGWLFFTGQNSVAYIEGRNPFSESELEAWRLSLRQRNDWLASRGIRYLVVFAPGKPSVYPEHLPRWVRPSSHGTRLDQLMGAMQSCPEVPVLDLRPALLGIKKLALAYSPTDTHWNMVGAWAAYDAIMKALTRWFPEAQPTPPSGFDVAWGRGPGGDLAAMAGIKGLVSEPIVWVAPRTPSRCRTLPSGDYATLRAWPKLQEPVITVRDHGDIPSVVVFRDSFSVALVPYLSEHFGRAVYLWIQDFEPSVIEREKPDLVIQEYTERMLSVLSPANPPALTAEPVKPMRN
jgi:alginate O-acetyltransferase complex protein AlgJ